MKTSRALVALALTFGTLAQADVVTDWNNVALNAIRVDRTAPPKASRSLAMLHVAIYDSINGIKREYQPYLVPGGKVPASADLTAAASAAAHKILVNQFPAQKTTFDSAYQAALAGSRKSPQRRAGIAWGESVATQVLAARLDDGSTNVVAPPSGSGPGAWVPTPPAFAPYLLPQWGFVRPFCMQSSIQFRPGGPPDLTSARYAQDLNEIKLLGAATNSTRTPDQTQIALFWADGAGTQTPPGHWNSIAQEVAAAQGNTVPENARLFALLNLAMADAAICAWDAKYHYNFWRAVTAIRNADQDGNPATDPDPNWSSLIATPPFPDYVSGHSTFSAAGATILALFYGTDQISFQSTSDALPGVQRQFSSFSEAAEEAAVSRLYGGIHFRTANDDGLQGGLAIGHWVMQHFLQPKGNRSRLK